MTIPAGSKPEPNDAVEPKAGGDSLLIRAPGVVLLAIAAADFWHFADPDIWGHVRFGEDLLRLGHIVWRDHYSYTAAGRPWLNYEWLGEAVMAAFYNSLGVFGLRLMKLACSTLIIGFLAASAAETGATAPVQGAVLIVTAAAIALQIKFRPLSFTFVLFSALLYLLVRDCYDAPREPALRRPMRLWLAIPMLALWANLHGGYLAGLAALWTYAAVAGATELAARRGAARMLRLGAIAALSTLATLATPYGIGTWLSALRTVFDPYTGMFLHEWQPLVPLAMAGLRTGSAAVLYYGLAFALMAALAAALIFGFDAADLPLVAIAAVMSAAAFAAVRNISLAAIAIAPPLAGHLSIALARWRPAIGRKPASAATRIALALMPAAALLMVLRDGLFSRRLEAIYPQPMAACEFMKRAHLKGNLLALYGWGEYAIWHLAPESKVFIDGRYDTVYPRDAMADYFRFEFNFPGGEAALTKYPTDFVLIGPGQPARRLMDSERGWRLIYRDEVSLLYARTDSSAAHLPGAPFMGIAYPAAFP